MLYVTTLGGRVYFPDPLELEQAGWRKSPTGDNAWAAKYPGDADWWRPDPARADVLQRLRPDYETGRLAAFEHERPAPGRWPPPGCRLFGGYLRDAADFHTLLNLLRWQANA